VKLIEIEHKCKEIESTKRQLEEKLTELRKLESKAKEKTKEAQLLEEIAKLRGEDYEGEFELEELTQIRKGVKSYQDKIENLEQEAYEGLKDVAFDIPLEVPKVDSQGRSIIKFGGEPCSCAVGFVASTLGSDAPLELDKTELHSDKIVINNVVEPAQVIERLKILRSNISRLARIALQEKDLGVEEVADYLHGSDYREVWEAIKGRKRVSYSDLFSELGLTMSKEKRKVRNFFTNLEHLLKDKFPFIRVSPGVYELGFFGSLVWKRYCDKYHLEKETAKELRHEAVVKAPVKKEEKASKMSSLNKYLGSDEVKEVIYGKEVS